MQLPIGAAASLTVRETLPEARSIGCSDLRFESCSGSWEDCQPGDLFVAIDAATGDGHEFAQLAIERGAAGIVTERLLAVDAPQFLVEDTRRAFGSICHALAGQPSCRMTTIGITGSDGKTVTSHLTDSIFRNAGRSVAVHNTLKQTAADPEVANRSGPDSLCPASLSGWLSRQVAQHCNVAVIETSSQSLAQHATAGTRFDVGVITNIRQDNSLAHGSHQNHQRVLQRITEQLKAGGIAVVNADDPLSAPVLQRLTVPTLTIGIRQAADVTARIIETDLTGQTFCLNAGNDSAVIHTPVIGHQHVLNCLAAAATGLSQNLTLEQVARGIELAGPLPGRMQRIECGQPFAVWIDSAVRPSQIASAAHSIRQVTHGKLLVAVTIDPEQSPHQRKRIGELIRRRMDSVVITQPDCGMISDYEPAHQILDGVYQHDQVRLIPNRMDAIEWLLSEARPGDAVLITGVGEKPIATLAEEKWTVTDAELVQAWLYDNQAGFSPATARRRQIYRMQDYLQ